MPKIITSSSNISILESAIIVDLCAGKFYIDLISSTFIGSGAFNALGAKVRITNPYGVVIKDYLSVDYDILPPFDSTFEFNISTSAGNYEYGEFKIDVEITDADFQTYTITKTVNPCYPDIQNKSRNYGSLGAKIKAVCKENLVYVAVDNLPTYNGLLSGAVTQLFELEYPSGSLPKATRTLSYFSDYLFEGVYKLTGEICATYNDDDYISYRVKYKVSAKKEVLCQIDDCAVFANFKSLHDKLNSNCKESERIETGNVMLEALALYNTAKLANDCGEDASDYIKQLEDLLGCKCTCNAGVAPINNSTPASSIVIEGCNIEESVDGLTRKYKFNNYTYVVDVNPNGGYLTVSSPQIADCTSTQTLTFDIAKVYTQMKAYANENITEANFWASVTNKAITSATPPDGTTPEAWAAMTFLQRVQAIIDAIATVAGDIPDVPAAYVQPTFRNGLIFNSGANTVELGNPLLHDTTISGAYKLALTQARVGIGKDPIFPFDILLTDPAYNLASQVTMAMPLENGKARIGSFSALQIQGVTFTANQSNQVAGATGQVVFYNSGLHQLNQYTNYAGQVGILIGFAGGTVTGSVIAALSAITLFGNGGSYDEVAGLRITAPQGSNFSDATDFSGTINNFYYLELDAFSPTSFPNGGIVNRWGIYQKGTETNRFGGKIIFDSTLNAGTGSLTINKPAGTFTIAAGQTSAVITNSMVTTSSIVWVQLGTIDATATSVIATEAAGSFTVTLNAAATGAVKIKFLVH